MAALAEAEPRELAGGLKQVGVQADYVELRPPEIGLVMVRGRIGGDGAPFNLGETTVTRASVQIASGEIGIAYIVGRNPDKARLAALCDALWQSKKHRAAVERHVLTPIRARRDLESARTRAQTAATRAEFFTMVRGED
jgi:alpha-D-ribose 1-methylphosphonate 5-triphosphate synthase subunit PhnG